MAVDVLNQFETAVLNKQYQVDRTPYIEKYEKANAPFLICLRPLGFNKPLFLSMLCTYYDIAATAKRKTLFKRFYIGRHTSPLANSFYILFFDFSTIDLTSVALIEQYYRTVISSSLSDFQERYGYYAVSSQPSPGKLASPAVLLFNFVSNIATSPVFVFINEYDGFQSEILDSDFTAKSASNQSNPVIRHLYTVVKEALVKGKIARVFVLAADFSDDR